MGLLMNVGVAVLLAVCMHRGFRIYMLSRESAHNHMHHPGPCRQVEGIQLGSEDFEVLSNGQTFISSGLRYEQMNAQCQKHFRQQGIRGRIYLLDLATPGAEARELPITSSPLFQPESFAPHGLSVWEDKEKGRHTLFVVNHRVQTGPFDSRVEKFVYDPDQQALVHVATFTDPTMLVVNDVQATGENSFYFTNCNYFQNMVGAMLETLLELSLTNVVHYNGHSYSVVASELKGPNGVSMSLDKKVVYVANTVAREILVYRRNQDNTLTQIQEYPVHTWPDNILVDQSTGHLYVGCHPQLFYFAFHYIQDLATRHSPSQVLQLQVKDGLITASQEVLYDHGHMMSGSSSAVVFSKTLLVGTVFDRLVSCQVHVPLLQ